jgi:hypothetical protein
MPPVSVEIQPRPRADEATQHADGEDIEFVPDLDTYVEHSMCSCSAGDDNPY